MSDYLEKAISCIRDAENRQALEYLRKAIKFDKDNPEIFRNMGLAASNLGDYEKAEKYWEKSLALDPNHHMTWWCLGNLYEGKGRFYEAYQAYEKAESVAREQGDREKVKRYREWQNLVKKKFVRE